MPISLPELVKYITENPNKAYESVSACSGNTNLWKQQYYSDLHDVTKTAKRPDKTVFKPTGRQDAAGVDTYYEGIEYVARITLPLQMEIVNTAAMFLVGNPIQLDCSPQTEVEKNMIAAVKKIWDANKLDYKSKTLARRLFSETEVAEVWYPEDAPQGFWNGTYLQNTTRRIKGNYAPIGRFRIKIISPDLGDKLYPVFDPSGDMVAFGREYEINTENHLDIYTDTYLYEGVYNDGWKFETKQHNIGKIPVIYYAQDVPDWHYVQTMIDRIEKLLSNYADTIDYFGNPKMIMSGEIKSMPAKGEGGQVFELEKEAKMEYLTWDMVPEAVKFEIETLMSNIYRFTSTIDLSPETMKGFFGSAPSAYVVKLVFMKAHMKASEKEEVFGESVQRRINLLKHFVTLLDPTLKSTAANFSIKPKFEYYLPKDTAGQIETINKAVSGGIMSEATGTKQNPLIEDADAELIAIKAEHDAQVKEQQAKAQPTTDA